MNEVMIRGSDTTRRPSGSIWGKFPSEGALKNGPANFGFLVHDDFEGAESIDTSSALAGNWNTNAANYEIYAEQGATITDEGVAGGVVSFQSDGDNEGVSIGANVGNVLLASASRMVAYECRIRTSTVADTKHGIFAGLLVSGAIATTVPIAAGGTLADTNFIGFHRLEGDGDQIDVVYKADGQSQQSLITDALSTALTADEWIKLGFLFDNQHPSAKKIKFFVNGVELTTYVTETLMDAATFPDDVYLSAAFAMKNATASTPGSANIDWHRWGQVLDA